MSKSRFKSTPKDSSPSSSSLTHDNNPRPAKRPRLTRSSSSASVTQSTKDSTPPTDIDSARKASALRVLNVWSQLAERYNKRMDEDDIIDLYSGAIIKDRGVLRSANTDYDIGRFAGDDGQEDSEEEPEEDEDADELDLLPRREAASDEFKTLLSGMPPLSTTTDADDLSDFLEEERRRRELVRGEDDEDEDEDGVEKERMVSPQPVTRLPERTPARKGHGSMVQNAKKIPVKIEDSSGAEGEDEEGSVGGSNEEQEGPEEGESSEDELAVWGHTESSPVWPGSTPKSSVRDAAVDHEVIEITDSDSDREFSLLLKGPSRKRRRSVSPSPAPRPSPRPLIPQNHVTPCPSTPHHEIRPPIPFDPVRAQEAQYLLAQAMHQLSYLMSTVLPAYTPSPHPPTPCHSFSPSIRSPMAYDSSPSVSRSHSHTRSFLPPSSRLSMSSSLPSSSPPPSSSSSSLADERYALAWAPTPTNLRKVSVKIEKDNKSHSATHRK